MPCEGAYEILVIRMYVHLRKPGNLDRSPAMIFQDMDNLVITRFMACIPEHWKQLPAIMKRVSKR
jgi:hypothetical protein